MGILGIEDFLNNDFMILTSGQIQQRQRQTVGNAQTLKQIFKSVSATSCPHTYNFHMHTACSDGKLSPAELMQQAFDIGLRAFAITDHHTVEGYYRAKRWLEDWHWRNPRSFHFAKSGDARSGSSPRLFTGVEITASLGDTEVHILGYGFNPHHEAIVAYLQGGAPRGEGMAATRVISAIQTAGGLAVLAHPARYRVPADVLVPLAADLGIDGVEAYYAYANPQQWQPCSEQTPRIEALAQQFQLLTTCGTDTHGGNLLRRI
jgi:predicted metal-dependent phosphoesterase TrpH